MYNNRKFVELDSSWRPSVHPFSVLCLLWGFVNTSSLQEFPISSIYSSEQGNEKGPKTAKGLFGDLQGTFLYTLLFFL